MINNSIKRISIIDNKKFLNTLKVFKLNKSKNFKTLQSTYFLINYKNKLLTIKNSDLDNVITADFTIETDLDLPDQEFLIDTKLLFDAVNSCKKYNCLEILLENNQAIIGLFKMPVLLPDERDLNTFKLEEIKENSSTLLEFNIDWETLIKNIKNCLNFASRDETRFYLNGVAIKSKENDLFFYASQGQMAIKNNNSNILKDIDNSSEKFFILPNELCKIIIASQDFLKNAKIKINKRFRCFITIQADQFLIDARLIDDEFPDIDRVIPGDGFIIKYNVNSLIDALKTANKINNDKHNSTELKLINNRKLLLIKKNGDDIALQIPLDVVCEEREEFSFGVNSKQLLTCIETYKNFTNQGDINIIYQRGGDGMYRPCKISFGDLVIILQPIRL